MKVEEKQNLILITFILLIMFSAIYRDSPAMWIFSQKSIVLVITGSESLWPEMGFTATVCPSEEL